MAINKKQLAIQKHMKEVLKLLGYSLDDPNFRDTPKRVAKVFYNELLIPHKPYRKLFTTTPTESKAMVTLQGHRGWTRCPHHLERVKLITDIAYIPDGKHLGISKLARIADYMAHGLVLQEDYTDTLAQGLFEALRPLGVAVRVKGEHLCMQARGVRSTSGVTLTSSLKGVFLEQGDSRMEFMSQIQ